MTSSGKPLSLIALVTVGVVSAIALALGGSNPSPADYSRFAQDRISTYLREEGCPKLTSEMDRLGLMAFLKPGSVGKNCALAVTLMQPQIRSWVLQNTRRRNFWLFSIYETDIDLPGPLPHYHFATVGIATKLMTYEAQALP